MRNSIANGLTKDGMIEKLVDLAVRRGALRTEDHGKDVKTFRRWLRTRTKGELKDFLKGKTP